MHQEARQASRRRSLLLVFDRLDVLVSLALLLLLALRHTDQPVEEDGHADIEDDIGEKDAEIAPAVRVAHLELRQKGVRAVVGR